MEAGSEGKKVTIRIEYVPVDDLVTSEYNPRKHTDKQMRDLSESIRKFGMVDPLVANSSKDRKNVVIGGHFRLEAAKKAGMATVPVAYVDIRDLAKEKELNLRLNKNVGEWDFEILKEFDVGFLVGAGFGNAELSDVWDSILGVENDNSDENGVKKLAEEPRAKPGQLYSLGEHRLLCGDSTDPTAVARLAASA